ncbi:MAG: MmgE/PrpD family protein [Alphaproteobacteria bacterium]|nr:MmgE/PrpD family protein [Alphaproteobacteria bacterium]
MDAMQTFAEFTRDVSVDTLPDVTVDASARLALDTIGGALAAWNAPGVRELRAILSQWGAGPSRVWVGGERLSPPAATLVNSSMAHALEYDDLHCELPIHAGVIVVPAVLAVADAEPDVSGAQVAAALVAGTEIVCRLARATRSYFGDAGFRGWNPSAVVAGFGAAAAAARVLDLDAAGIARAMGLSYAQAAGNQQCIEDGGLVKRMQPGMIAEAGVRAAWLAQAGVTGAINAIEGRNGYFAVYEQGEYDAERLTEGLGSNFEIERVGFKRYPICGMAQPAVDALRDLQREHEFSLEDVDTLEVYGSKFVMDMVGRPYEPGESPDVDAQFSLQYCLATVLLTGSVRLDDLKPEHTLGAERRELAARIPIRLDESLKGKWTARLELKLRDGRRLGRTRDKAAGQSDLPLTTDELVAKFRDCNIAGGPAMDASAAQALCDLLLDLPRLPRLEPLCDALAPAESVRCAG